MNRRQTQVTRHGARRCAAVHPGQLDSGQGEGEVLGSFNETAVLWIEEDRRDAGFVVRP